MRRRAKPRQGRLKGGAKGVGGGAKGLRRRVEGASRGGKGSVEPFRRWTTNRRRTTKRSRSGRARANAMFARSGRFAVGRRSNERPGDVPDNLNGRETTLPFIVNETRLLTRRASGNFLKTSRLFYFRRIFRLILTLFPIFRLKFLFVDF